MHDALCIHHHDGFADDLAIVTGNADLLRSTHSAGNPSICTSRRLFLRVRPYTPGRLILRTGWACVDLPAAVITECVGPSVQH